MNNQAHRKRLRRLDRIFSRDPVFFVTACTRERTPMLDNQTVDDAFRGFAECGPQRGVYVGRYVLMPDHLHAFVGFQDAEMSLSSWMKSLKNALSKVFRSQGIQAPHWQKGFFDHVLRSLSSLEEKWEYVRNNPVRAGLVRETNAWPFQGRIFDLEYRKS